MSLALQKAKMQQLLPRVRFEAISVGVALALKERPDLHIDNVDWLNSEEFKELTTSDASNNEGKLAAVWSMCATNCWGETNDYDT